MTTINPNSSYMVQPNASQVSIVGLIFFLLGAPHLYGFLKRRAERPKSSRTAQLVMLALLAGAIASVVEVSLL